MGLIYDDPQLAALTLARIAAGESEGPSESTGRMHAVLDDLSQRNGPEYLAELIIVLARARFYALDDLARATGVLGRFAGGACPTGESRACPGCCEDATG